jgi:hypothetical protein
MFSAKPTLCRNELRRSDVNSALERGEMGSVFVHVARWLFQAAWCLMPVRKLYERFTGVRLRELADIRSTASIEKWTQVSRNIFDHKDPGNLLL